MHQLLNGKSKNLSLYSMTTIKDCISIFIIWYLIIYESKNLFYIKIIYHTNRK